MHYLVISHFNFNVHFALRGILKQHITCKRMGTQTPPNKTIWTQSFTNSPTVQHTQSPPRSPEKSVFLQHRPNPEVVGPVLENAAWAGLRLYQLRQWHHTTKMWQPPVSWLTVDLALPADLITSKGPSSSTSAGTLDHLSKMEISKLSVLLIPQRPTHRAGTVSAGCWNSTRWACIRAQSLGKDEGWTIGGRAEVAGGGVLELFLWFPL